MVIINIAATNTNVTVNGYIDNHMNLSPSLLTKIRQCNLCEKVLPNPPNPVLQFQHSAKIMLIGQAPGIHAHQTNTPWNDASGKRLREWLMLPETDFYNSAKIAIVPMGFCYPGKGKSGDLPPRPECASTWHEQSETHYHNCR